MIAPLIPDNDIERVNSLKAMNLNDSSRQEQLMKVMNITSKCLNFPISYISSVESTEQCVHVSLGLNFKYSPRATSFCGHTILQKDPLIINDTLKDDRFKNNPMVLGDPKIRFYAGYPLLSEDGYPIGSLCVADHKPRELTAVEYTLFTNLGSLVQDRIHLFKAFDYQKELEKTKKQMEKTHEKLKKHNTFYKKVFGQYMSEEFLDTILKDDHGVALGGEESVATVLMSDIRGFTQLSEQYEAQTVVDILNTYLEEMIEVIAAHEGFINEILGDGILVVFGVPVHLDNCALRAVRCAFAMHEGLKRVNKKLKNKGLPTLEMGIGINSGNLIAGNIGSKKRMKYGVVGDTVNIAARIESLTVAGQTLVSEVTHEKVKDYVKEEGYLKVKVKGATHPITIYDLSGCVIAQKKSQLIDDLFI